MPDQNEEMYYHYLSDKNAIDDLEKQHMRVSTLDTLNDPFEMKPYLRYDRRGRRPYDDLYRKIKEKWGLLCFTQGWSEPLLWSHYAGKHKGIALGFEILRGEVLKVEYTPELKRQKIRLTGDSETDERSFLDLAKVKYKEWEYENEYRILVELKDCPPDDKGRHFLRFGNRLRVREIVLGCKFDHKGKFGDNKERKKDIVIRLAEKLGAGVTATREQWEGYEIVPCGYTNNKYYAEVQTR